MILYIKNMVCDRCIMTVDKILRELGHQPSAVEMGKVTLNSTPSAAQLAEIDRQLTSVGFELLNDPSEVIVERIKKAIINLVRNENACLENNLSANIANSLGIDYRQLSAVFSAHEHRTIEKYYIAQKIERVKELIAYGQLTLSEIAFKTGYSSVAHLSRQFKQVTGITATQFKSATSSRKPLDKV